MDKNIIKNKKTFLIDLDGTVYNGGILTNKADKFIEKLLENNLEYFFITNNAHQCAKDISDRLEKIGIKSNKKNIITCSDTTIDYVKTNYKDCSVQLVANDYLKNLFKDNGFNITSSNPDVVIVGFDDKLTFDTLSSAVQNVLNGAVLICTGVDGSIPSDNGILPYTGAICKSIEAATHIDAIYMGKPEKYIFNTIFKKTKNSITDCLMIGDRLDTDIDFGKSNGIDTCLTLTGLTDEKLLEKSTIKPDIIVSDLGELMDLI